MTWVSIRRRRIEFNKPMKLTVACGARSLSAALGVN